MTYSFTCSCCGEMHEELPFAYGADAPVYWHAIPEAERNDRATLDGDLCVIDDCYFFVRASIRIPVVDTGEEFSWDVWVSLSRANFARMLDHWEDPERDREAPYFGWLSSELPLYPPTLNLKAMVHTRPLGECPLVELEPTDHPLSVEQREGITLQRVQEIAEQLLHG